MGLNLALHLCAVRICSGFLKKLLMGRHKNWAVMCQIRFVLQIRGENLGMLFTKWYGSDLTQGTSEVSHCPLILMMVMPVHYIT
jgi:hypothetical protein